MQKMFRFNNHLLVLVTLLLNVASLSLSSSTFHQYNLDNSIYDDYEISSESESNSGETQPSSSQQHQSLKQPAVESNGHIKPLEGPVSQPKSKLPSLDSIHKLSSSQTHSSPFYFNFDIYNNQNSEKSNDTANVTSQAQIRCRTDQNCHGDSVCNVETGDCVHLCNIKHKKRPTESDNKHDCLYFHCEGKQLLVLDGFTGSKKINEDSEFKIETNNYPELSRYLSRRRCAWILKNQKDVGLYAQSSSGSVNGGGNQETPAADIIQKLTIPYVRLKVSRFATEFNNDYLYIFAGDSIYSPLIATLSGSDLSSNEASLAADLEGVIISEHKTTSLPESSFNITLFNMKDAYFLFKTDLISSLVSFNPYYFKAPTAGSSSSKPTGVSIKPELSSCVEEKYLDKNVVTSKTNCFDDLNSKKENVKDAKSRLVETIKYSNGQEDDNLVNDLNSTLRRAFHCSFNYKDYLYVIGGYSFSSQVSLVSRMNLVTLKWEHQLDRKTSTVVNRSNRKLFSNINFRQLKLELPQSRYAHSCVLDTLNDIVYMFGGIKYSNEKYAQFDFKETTNELWSLNLLTNKWTLLSGGSSNINSENQQNSGRFVVPGSRSYVLPIAVSGHSMHLIKNGNDNSTLITIFFGYSEYYGSNLNLIQEFNPESKVWSYRNVYNINIGYAHTSTYNPVDNRIYFYGGLLLTSHMPNSFDPIKTLLFDTVSDSMFSSTNARSASASAGSPPIIASMPIFGSSNTAGSSNGPAGASSIYSTKFYTAPHLSSFLYAYNLESYEFKQLSKSMQTTFMHSALIYYGNYLLIYGGVVIENAQPNWLFPPPGASTTNTNSQYISNQFRVYSINENRWLNRFVIGNQKASKRNADDKEEISLAAIYLNKRQRYAHTAFLYNDSMHVLAGYNGFFLRDMFRINVNTLLDEKYKLNYEGIYTSRNQIPITFGRWQNSASTQSNPNSFYNRLSNILLPSSDHDVFMMSNNHNNDSSASSSSSNGPSSSSMFMYGEAISYHDFLCSKYASCSMCQMDPSCIWNGRKCEYYNQYYPSSLRPGGGQSVVYKKPSTCQTMCSEHKSCLNCTTLSSMNGQYYQNECVWCASQAKCVLRKAIMIMYSFSECLKLINDREQCDGVDNKHQHQQYAESSEEGLILTETPAATDSSSTVASTCAQLYSNCSACIQDERCGWCTRDSGDIEASSFSWMFENAAQNTGHGQCMEGGQSGPLSQCSRNWFYSNCPACECNGHSTCVRNVTSPATVIYDNVDLACKECHNNTQGEHCSECRSGYFGQASNNGQCLRCQCGQQATECDSINGRCYCNAKGVIGTQCDQCDSPRYTGKPHLADGTCYYNLTTDYQFTFNLNKEMDRYYTRISFVNHPIRYIDDDIDFMVRCFRETALINVSYALDYDYENSVWHNEALLTSTPSDASNITTTTSRSKSSTTTGIHRLSGLLSPPINYYFGPRRAQNFLLVKLNCTNNEFKYTFSNKELGYSDRPLVFVVHVYDFRTPISIQIAFSRKSKVHLLHFFITFFGCLLTLLTIAFITWKTKQRYDRYRRQREVLQQMEHMASRPFTKLCVDVSGGDAKLMEVKQAASQGAAATILSKKVKKGGKTNDHPTIDNRGGVSSIPRVMPIAVEPLNTNKTAVLTCLLKLPQGGLNTTPKGSSPLVLCSAYVNVNSDLVNYVSSPTFANLDDDDGQNDQNGDGSRTTTKTVHA